MDGKFPALSDSEFAERAKNLNTALYAFLSTIMAVRIGRRSSWEFERGRGEHAGGLSEL